MNTTRVLNVNDSEANRYLISRMLGNAGFEIIEAANGAVALELCAEDPPPDIVVLDVKMPGLDGFEVCRRIKADPETARIKILHTSAAHVGIDSKIKGLEAGADAYLFQPFEEPELVATVRSLARLRETERELRSKAERLAGADRRKDEFLAMLAHELRNPLAALTSALAILEGYPERDEVEVKNRSIFRRQITQLTRLVDDLLDVSRVTRGMIRLRREQVDLSPLLEKIVATQRDLPREQGPIPRLALDLPDRPLLVSGDPGRLEQSFTNLVDNAIKYTDADGAITLAARVEPHGPDGRRVIVRVTDTGIGIEPEKLAGLFDLFSQAHVSLARSQGGLGIGLTLVKRLVELHDGTISIASEGHDRGTTVEIALPLLPAGSEDAEGAGAAEAADDRPAEPEAAPPSEDVTGGRHLLVIEDNRDVREAMRELAQIWGHRVSIAEDGQQGVEMALETAPDLALIDIGLPGIDGFEVARRIRGDARGGRVHLVALTGYGSEEHQREAREAGFDDFMVKPGEPATLRELLEGPLRGDARGSSESTPVPVPTASGSTDG